MYERLAAVCQRLRATAQAVDASFEPPAQQMAWLAESGYFRHTADVGPAERRRLLDLLSSGCGATAFLASQHEASCRRLHRAAHPLFESAVKGEVWVGVCFAHLRRQPSPVAVTRQGQSLLFQGVGPWFSGVGLMSQVLVAGATDDGEFLMALSPLERPEIEVGESTPLAVMNATATAPLAFHQLEVPLPDLVVTTSAAQMSQDDQHSTVFQSSRSLGVARAAAEFLPASARDRLLDRLEAQHQKMDAWDQRPAWASAVALRKEALELAALAVQAALMSSGGAAHSLTHPVQRLAREASFYATTQLTSELKEAFLNDL